MHNGANTTMTTEQPKDLATSFLHIRALPQDKSAWVRTANRRGKKLSVHVTDTLNAESAKDQERQIP